MRQAKEAAHRQSTVLVIPLNAAPPPPEFTAQSGEAGGEFPIMERGGGDASMTGTVVPPPPPPPPSGSAHDKQRAHPLVLPTKDEAVAKLLLQVGSPVRHRLEKATPAPRPLETPRR